MHRGVPRHLDEVLSWEVERVVQRDWTVVCEGQWYQLDRQHEALSLAGRPVVVRTLRNGRKQMLHRGVKLKWRALPGRAPRPKDLRPLQKVRTAKPPSLEHPWRRFGMGAGRPYWRQQKRKRSSGRGESVTRWRPAATRAECSNARRRRSPARSNKRREHVLCKSEKGDIFS